MHGPRQRRVRPDLRPGTGQNPPPTAEQSETHPLHGTDRRRILLFRARRSVRDHLRECQRDRTPGRPPLLRSRSESSRPRYRRQQKEPHLIVSIHVSRFTRLSSEVLLTNEGHASFLIRNTCRLTSSPSPHPS